MIRERRRCGLVSRYLDFSLDPVTRVQNDDNMLPVSITQRV